MIPSTCLTGITGVLNFQHDSSKDLNLKKEIVKLREQIISFFENVKMDLRQLKKEIKDLVYKSEIFSGAKQKIVKLLEKMKWLTIT